MTLAVRPATPNDAPAAGEFILDTMGELGTVIFGLDDRQRAVSSLSSLFSVPDNRFSYQQAFIAEEDGQTLGMLLAYPGVILARLERPLLRQLLRLYSLPELLRLAWRALPLFDGIEADKDEYYIAHVAVVPQARGRGIGSQLMRLAEDQCRRAGLQKCSLCVDYGHEAARTLYLKIGYQIVETHTNPPHIVRRLKWGGYERMVKKIDQTNQSTD
jgi:ribosomal protein S18 acetylase RimI-like enzyme